MRTITNITISTASIITVVIITTTTTTTTTATTTTTTTTATTAATTGTATIDTIMPTARYLLAGGYHLPHYANSPVVLTVCWLTPSLAARNHSPEPVYSPP